jgi:hypothetical protein
MWAEIVEEGVANTVARSFFAHMTKSTGTVSSIKGYPFSDAAQPDLYIVSFEPSGYVLLAADDRSEPILGYAIDSSFPLNDIPAHVKWYLSQYSKSIAEIREHPEWEKDPNWEKLINHNFSQYYYTRDVSPLCQTTWNQNWPYNSLCPEDVDGSGGRVLAGCVSTAMAQIMKKWEHPTQGQGSHSYYASGYGNQTADFGNTTYAWQDMPNSIAQENLDISTLIYHCGVAVNMQYGPDWSGAYSIDARNALINYFKYDEGAQYTFASYYSTSEWASMLRNDLDLTRPIYYGGSGPDGGHAFVLDGYQGTNYFHFNWGWSGAYDGYFYLNNLNPGSMSFTNSQEAILHIRPIRENQNDLAATSISGANLLNAGQEYSYQITIQNVGLSAQSDYVVQLYRDNGILIGATAGSLIQPEESITFGIAWTPDIQGAHTLYGAVSLASDQNPANNTSSTLAVDILAGGSVIVQIGFGEDYNNTTDGATPYGTWFKAFRQQYLILSSELSAAGVSTGDISGLGFEVANLNNCSPMPNYTIRLKHTNLTALSSNFETGNYQSVCQYAEYMPTSGWNNHVFQAPFFWDGVSNIIVEVLTDLIPGSYTNNASVYYTPTTFNSALRFNSDSANGITGTTGTYSQERANMRFILLGGGGDDPILRAAPSSIDFGNVVLGISSAPATVTVFNMGGGNLVLNASNLSFTGAQADYFSFDNTVFPISLGAGQSATIPISATATALGAFSGALQFNYGGETIAVLLSGTCVSSVITEFPFFEGFEVGNTQDSMDIYQWTQVRGPQYLNQYWTANSTETMYNRTPRSGNWNATLVFAGESTLVHPIMLEAGESYSLEFYARQDGTIGAAVKAVLGDNELLSGDVIQIMPASAVVNGNYQRFYTEFTAPGTGLYYIGIYGYVNTTPWFLSLDDITIDLVDNSENLVPPNNLQASVDGMNVSLTWNAPDDIVEPQWITWCNENSNVSSIGTGSATVFSVAHRYEASDLLPYQGMAITKMKFMPNEANCSYSVKVWTGTSASAPSTLIYTQAITSPTIGAWNVVSFNTPIPIPATGELWIGYEVNTQTGHPATCDSGPQIAGKGNMMYFNNQWIQLTQANASFTYNWLILAYVENAAGAAQALTFQPIQEEQREILSELNFSAQTMMSLKQIEPFTRELNRAHLGYKVYRNSNLITTINNPAALSYLDTVTAAGTYTYTVTAIYDDGESIPAGPVQVVVNEPAAPAFAITPGSHNFGQVSVGQSRSQQFTVSNTGGGTLTINSITISAAMMSLGSLPTLPANLAAGQTLNFNAIYAPTAEGAHTGTITVSDNLSRVSHTVALSGTSIDYDEIYPPTNLQASVSGMDVTLTWDAPVTGDWITWCNPSDTGSAVGTNSAAVFDVAHRFDANDLANYQGSAISKVSFVPKQVSCVYTIKIWTGTSASAPSTLVYSQVVNSPTIGSWNEIMLNTPVSIPTSGELWIGYESNTQTGHPAGCDNGPAINGKGNMINLGGWDTLIGIAPSLNYNWFIQAYVDHDARALTFADQQQICEPVAQTNVSGNARSILELSMDSKLTPVTGEITGETRSLTGYNLYRNNALLANISGSAELIYVDTVTNFGSYSYTVTAVYDNGESAPEGPVEITIDELEPPTDLSAVVNLNTVSLTWSNPTPSLDGEWISWSDNETVGNSIGTGSAASFEVAHRYAVSDLVSHVGGRIAKVMIAPGYADCVYTIKVWTGGNSSSPGNLMTTQVLENPQVGVWNTIVLNNPVEILAGQELWIGYHVNTQGGHPAGCDHGPMISGKGNMMNMGGWTTLDAVASSLTYNWQIQGLVVQTRDGKNIESPILVDSQNTSPMSTLSLAQISPQKDRDVVLTGYKVYRDGAQITTINDPDATFFFQNSVANGTYLYGVSAVYNTGESSPATIQVTVNIALEDAVFTDSFEEYADFATAFEPWTLIDQDGSLSYSISNIEFPGNGSAFAYMIFNPTQTVPQIIEPLAYEGNKMAASFAAQTPPNNDYLITPRIQLGTNSAIKFYARSHTATYGLERFKVGVSTLPDPLITSEYNYISGDDYLQAPANWTEYYFDLSSYDKQQVYITIRCISDDAFVFYVDNFAVHTHTTSTEDEFTPIAVTQLAGNYPNPFNPETTISYSMKEAGSVSIDIYNVKGQLVKHLVNGEMTAGKHSIVWNGRDDNNHAVSSGVYFYKMNSGIYSSTKKMIMMK